ncbi:MAG: aminotransferase class V-fold PLP-dependent enzyme, partial [Planctomycetes bacterium]|nr:aminotransferase class V-fold PLP-dependent enzyme [Planctomycetota bacterium]
LKLEAGEELIYSDLEYPSMVQAIEMRAKRYGTPIRQFDIPNVPSTKEEVIEACRKAIGPKTKVMLISHMVFLNGLVPPIREICDLCHERGVEVIVDGAHAFAHVDWKVPDLHCDYYGTSLHKWLGSPLGTGMLYIKKEKIPRVWPLYAEMEKGDDSIEKFERTGTRPPHSYIGMEEAIRVHEAIGGKNKEARLRYLKNSWVSRVKELPRVKILSPITDDMSCAICSFSIEGMDPKDLADALMNRYGVFVAGLKSEYGVRVCPNLYTKPEHLDRLVMAIRELAV